MATLIHAEIVRKNKSILLYITNNGKPPEGVVVPKGGLLNLLRYVAGLRRKNENRIAAAVCAVD